ncbi:MAG: ABC transporter permease [candidate division WOR-3 bacterium]
MRALAYAIRADFVKYLAEFRYYGFNYFFWVMGSAVLFLGIVAVAAQTATVSPEAFFKMLMGFMLWWYAISPMYEMSYIAWEDAVLGTLEHVYMSPMPFGLILFSRGVAALMRDTFWFALMACVILGVYKLVGGNLSLPHVDWSGIAAVFPFPVASSMFMGVFFFGLALVFKRVGSATGLFQWVLLFFSGVFFDPGSQPLWIRLLAYATPVGPGAECLRRMIIEGRSLTRVLFSDAGLILFLNLVIYAVFGFLSLHLLLKIAKKKGKMSRY